MIYLYISLGVLLGILILLFIMAFLVHRKVFNRRYEPDGIIQYYTVKDFPLLKEKKIEIEDKRGILRGSIYSYHEDSKDLVVFAHGMWGSHSAYMQEIEVLARNGFHVLGFDYFGTERSSGKNIKGLGNSLLSLDCALTYVQKNYPNYNIYVMGHSWGSFASLGIAKYHPNIKRIVAMSPFISLSQILRHMLPRALRILIPFLVAIDFLCCGKYSLVHAKRVLKSSGVDTLIIHSKDDQMVPYLTSTADLERHITNPKISYLIVSDKGHNPDYSKEALEYTKESFSHLKSLNKEEALEYRKGLDYHKMGLLDMNIMKQITDFLKNEEKYAIK